jgi:MOSC domain-containing protein YiiM
MSVVLAGGTVRPGDGIEVEIPEGPGLPLEYIRDSHRPVRKPRIPFDAV